MFLLRSIYLRERTACLPPRFTLIAIAVADNCSFLLLAVPDTSVPLLGMSLAIVAYMEKEKAPYLVGRALVEVEIPRQESDQRHELI